jgi:hypothetical protein
MQFAEVRARLEAAIERFMEMDRYLLEHDLREECIAARLAMHLQSVFHPFSVDVEYNRFGDLAKSLHIPDACAKKLDTDGRARVLPDIIIHRRGPDGPNLLVVEMKKTTNPIGFDCDRIRLYQFRQELQYYFGVLLECETRAGQEPAIRISEWVPQPTW